MKPMPQRDSRLWHAPSKKLQAIDLSTFTSPKTLGIFIFPLNWKYGSKPNAWAEMWKEGRNFSSKGVKFRAIQVPLKTRNGIAVKRFKFEQLYQCKRQSSIVPFFHRFGSPREPFPSKSVESKCNLCSGLLHWRSSFYWQTLYLNQKLYQFTLIEWSFIWAA